MTLPIRLSRMPGEIEHFLDGASENSDLTPSAHTALMLYADPAVLARLIGDGEYVRGRTAIDAIAMAQEFDSGNVLRFMANARVISYRSAVAARVEMYAAEIINRLDADRRKVLKGEALMFVFKERRLAFDYLSDWRIRDATIGGGMESYRRDPDKVLLDGHGNPTPALQRRLMSPRRIRAYVRADQTAYRLHAMVKTILSIEGGVADFAPTVQEEIHHDFERQMAAFRAEQAVEWARLMGENPDCLPESIRRHLPKVRLDKKKLRDRRKVVVRSANIAASVIGDDKVRRLVKGEPVIIEGQDINFKINPRGSLHRSGHGAITITLQDKAGQNLAGLCLYEEAPLLDQVAAVGLYCSAGEELELINTGNLYGETPQSMGNPVIAERRVRALAERIHNDGLDVQRQAFADILAGRERRRELQQERRSDRYERRRPFLEDEHFRNVILKKHQKEAGHLYMREIDQIVFRGIGAAPMIRKEWEPGGVSDDPLPWMRQAA